MVYYLQEQLEEAQQATPPVLDTYDCTCGSAAELKRVEEELQLRERVVEVCVCPCVSVHACIYQEHVHVHCVFALTLQEKQSVVEGLKKDVADLQNRLSTLSEVHCMAHTLTHSHASYM